jgi:hypothetical protein
VTPHRFARSLLGSVALGVPFVLVAQAASAFVTPLTSATVAALVRMTAPLSAAASPAPDADVFVTPGDGYAPAAVVFEAATKGPHPGVKTKPKSAAAALFVSKASVLKLSQSAARPQGSFVAQTPEHPAGLRLVGVAALGIGVEDGDILIEALGITPRSPGQVIGAIIEARAKAPRFLSGTLWRRGQLIRITVEQPYVVVAAEASASSSSAAAPDASWDEPQSLVSQAR